MTFGQKLRSLRESSGLSRQDLGTRLGLSYWAVAKYEQDERVPDHEILGRIASFFGTSTDYLLGRTDDSTPIPTDNLATTARRLKAIRDSRAMSQRELADRLGISVPELARYESAIAAPPDELVDKLAEVFEVDRRYFTGEIPQEEIERLLGETWFRAPAELSPEERQSIEDYIAFVIARRQKKQGM